MKSRRANRVSEDESSPSRSAVPSTSVFKSLLTLTFSQSDLAFCSVLLLIIDTLVVPVWLHILFAATNGNQKD